MFRENAGMYMHPEETGGGENDTNNEVDNVEEADPKQRREFSNLGSRDLRQVYLSSGEDLDRKVKNSLQLAGGNGKNVNQEPVVIIATDGSSSRNKYIVMRDDRKRECFVSLPMNAQFTIHADIARYIQAKQIEANVHSQVVDDPARELDVLGGGFLEVSRDKVEVYGDSGQYGPADIQVVDRLLNQEMWNVLGRECFRCGVAMGHESWEQQVGQIGHGKELLSKMAAIAVEPNEQLDVKEQISRCAQTAQMAISGPKEWGIDFKLEVVDRVYRHANSLLAVSPEDKSVAARAWLGLCTIMSYNRDALANKAVQIYGEAVSAHKDDPEVVKKAAQVLGIIATDSWPETLAEYVEAAWGSGSPLLQDKCLWAVDYVTDQILERRESETASLQAQGEEMLGNFREALQGLWGKVSGALPEEAEQPSGKLKAVLTKLYSSEVNS